MKGEWNWTENALLISKLTAHTKWQGTRKAEEEMLEEEGKLEAGWKNKAYAPLDKPMNYAK